MGLGRKVRNSWLTITMTTTLSSSAPKRCYAARSAMADTSPSTRIFGVAEIVRFLSDSRSSLSMEQQRALFASPQLRADFQRLKAQVTLAEMPALAAASAGSIKTRRFDGGTVRVASLAATGPELGRAAI